MLYKQVNIFINNFFKYIQILYQRLISIFSIILILFSFFLLPQPASVIVNFFPKKFYFILFKLFYVRVRITGCIKYLHTFVFYTYTHSYIHIYNTITHLLVYNSPPQKNKIQKIKKKYNSNEIGSSLIQNGRRNRKKQYSQ